ncbi:hypothetical protein JW868_03715 [Candidatus Woesearchaeota archaeon]|nr:hypothetical protein [Candidatus Woesearchaeota archaeon]
MATTRKLNEEEWENFVRYNIQEKQIRQKKEKEEKRRRIMLKKLVPIPIALGMIAGVYYLVRFGWIEFEKMFISWLVGITLVAAIVTWIVEFERKV